MNNRQLAALETKKNLLAAAKKIIREKGLVNTSVAEIAKAAGVANGTFYTYFKRKEDIVYELGLEIYEELIERAKNYEGTFLERLTFFMTSFSADIEKKQFKALPGMGTQYCESKFSRKILSIVIKYIWI